MVNEICDIMVDFFEHIDITSKLDIDKRIKYTSLILTGPMLNKYCESFLACKDTMKEFYGRWCNFGGARDVIMEYFVVWENQDGLDVDKDEVRE